MILPALEPLLTTLRSSPEVHRVILFGSRARGDNSERSDIDLAIDAPALPRRAWLGLLDAADDAPTLLPINMVLLGTASEEFRRRIETEGKTLYDFGA